MFHAALSDTDPIGVSPSYSRLLWGLDWSKAPRFATVNDEIVAKPSSLREAKPFIDRHYASIFEHSEGAPFSMALGESKARYYDFAADFIEFERQGETIGLLIGAPTDWSTYYIRSAAVLPEFQGRQFIQHFFSRVLFGFLGAAGVERVELDTSPSNVAMMHIVTRLRFNVTGTLLTERWGAQTHFTKFLHPEREEIFLRQFCSGIKYQLRERSIA